MYDHIGLKVSNIDKSVRFYEAALKPRNTHCVRDDSGAGFGPRASRRSGSTRKDKAAGRHSVPRADHAAIKNFTRGVKAGGRDNGGAVHAPITADLLRRVPDRPDGNNVEAVCT